ncbi:MAG: hypothetical protein H5T72_00400 [Actinobacteria bacterium]|nr:hypothetical protein [Actinomycetota bacterium]
MAEERMWAMLGLVAVNNLGRDIFAAFIAALAGVAVLLYAAASDLFDLKFFKFDPFSLRYPREARIEYWYVRAARRFQAFLAGGGWSYAKLKKRAKVAFKRDWRRFRREARRMLPEAARRLNRDIALGALAIAVALVALLIMRLV